MNDRRPHIRAVVFDFDGTLFLTADAIVHSFRSALESAGRPDVAAADIERLIGRPLRAMFVTLAPDATPAELDTLVSAYRAVFAQVAPERSRPAPGFDQAIPALHAAGIRMAIATHRMSDGAQMILDRCHATHWFEALVAMEHIRRPKPAPDPLWQALAALGVPPDEAAAVGDTPDDVRAGMSAGMWSVGVETGVHPRTSLESAGAHAVIHSLAELPALLLRSPTARVRPPTTD